MTNVPSSIGRYAIVKVIGHGGMGSLYLAWDAKLERQIAIKVLKDDDDDLRERFAREAKAAARLRHPHIVTIFELGEHDGAPYIAMEYIEGRTLAQIIRDRDDMPLDRTLELMAALCDGLAFAHKAGIIHRDVKPANIMVDEGGSLKILDFGIARLAESLGMTQAGMMIGTLNYMSPEQVAGQPVDHRSDIFAVGLVFYELLAQAQAFPGTISSGMLPKLLRSEPVPLAQACPDLDEDVVRIVGRAIEKDMNRRYQDLTQMRREILTVRGHIQGLDTLTRATPSPHAPTPRPPSERRAPERGEIEAPPAESAPAIARLSGEADPVDLKLHTVPLPERSGQQQVPPMSGPAAQPFSSRAGRNAAIAAVSVVVLAGTVYWLGPLRSVAPDATTSNPQPVTPPQPQPQLPAPSPATPPIEPQVIRADELVREGQSRTQAGLSAAEQKQVKANAAAAETKTLEASRRAPRDRFNEGQTLEQRRQYDAADAKYREAIAADNDNKEAAAALARSEQYRKARAAGLSALSAKDRERALRELGDARNIHSARFLADGLDKVLTEAERLGGATVQPKAEPAPATDQSAIVAVLGNLSRALSTKTNSSHSPTVVRAIWPGAGGDVFGDNESQEYILRNLVFVSVTADQASVDGDRARVLTPRSTGKTSILYDSVRIELRKAKGAWQVASISERSK